MKKIILFCVINLILINLNAQDLIIKGGFYFDVLKKEMVKNDRILIISGKFLSIGGVKDIDNIPVIYLEDSDYILPGIIDVHAHYKVHISGKERTDTASLPKIYLANGVTTTFTAGEIEPEKIITLKKQINQNQRQGPRIFNAGPYFGYDGNSVNNYWKKGYSQKEIEELVDTWADKGIHGIKVKNVTPFELKIIIQRAHLHGLTVTGHLDSGFDGTVNSDDAINMGIDRVEHFLGGSTLADSISAYNTLAKANPFDIRFDSIINKFIQNQIFYSPTISTYGMVGNSEDKALSDWIDQLKFFTSYASKIIENQPSGLPFHLMMNNIYEYKKHEIKRFYDAGGKDLIVLGTDRQLRNGDIGGFGVHKEMSVLSDCGIPNNDILNIASINGANALGVGNSLGSIEVSKWADLYIVKGNPIEDIGNTKNVHTVIKNGEIYDPKALLDSVVRKLGPDNSEGW
ncbi:MAG: amidohydrolase family protein [Lutimonas sp.]